MARESVFFFWTQVGFLFVLFGIKPDKWMYIYGQLSNKRQLEYSSISRWCPNSQWPQYALLLRFQEFEALQVESYSYRKGLMKLVYHSIFVEIWKGF